MDRIAIAGRSALLKKLGGLVELELSKYMRENALPDPLDIPLLERARIEDAVIRGFLKASRPEKAKSKYDSLEVGEIRIDFVNRLPGLKTWAGGQKLDGIFWGLVDALPDDGPLLEARGTVDSVSGMSAEQRRVNALDLGFSPTSDMRYETSVGLDLFRIFAFSLLPATVYPDGRHKVAGEYIQKQPRGRDSYYSALVPAADFSDEE